MYDRQSLGARGFTQDAVKVVEDAGSRAHARGLLLVRSPPVDALVLWSLLRWERKLGKVALEQLHVDVQRLENELDDELRKCSSMESEVIACMPDVEWETLMEPFLVRAEDEAGKLGHDWVGTEHLLLAAVSRKDSMATDLVVRHQIGHEAIRHAVIELLSNTNKK